MTMLDVSPITVHPSSLRNGDWIQTYTGKAFYPLDPRVEEINIIDIAHALSMVCRFNGHCNEFYSVAEHCWRISLNVPEPYALWGLLHDASEAYISDVGRPTKKSLTNYAAIERGIMNRIAERFGLQGDQPACVSRMDLVLLHTEKRDLLNASPMRWATNIDPLLEEIVPMDQKNAKSMFLARFHQLYKGD